MSRFEDAALIDAVLGYCAYVDRPLAHLSDLTFLEVSKRLAFLAQTHPDWIRASKEIRQYYDVCHSDCHINRVRTFMANGGWREGQGAKAEPKVGNVVEFPTNLTKH